MHEPIEPAILYFGTPVVLITTMNSDGTSNIAPMSSAWWLGWSCMIGLDASSLTTQNLLRDGECVLNLASIELAQNVNALAKTTGRKSLPLHKRALGYRHVSDKWEEAGLTPTPSQHVQPPRIAEAGITLEATLPKACRLGALIPNWPSPPKPLNCKSTQSTATRI